MKTMLRGLLISLLTLHTLLAQVVVQPGNFKLGGVPVTGQANRDLNRYPRTSTGDAAFKARAESITRPFAITITSGVRSGQILAALGSEPTGTFPASTPPPATNTAQAFDTPFTYTSAANRINRMQSLARLPYADGWRMKTSEVIVGGNGGIVETPDELRKRGHNWFNARWFFFTDEPLPYGPPLSTDNLFLEIGGGEFQPYHRNPLLVLSQSMEQIATALAAQLPIVNNTPGRGLINGVPTIKYISYNIEYNWFTDNEWNAMDQNQRNSSFFNYQTNQTETFQQVYNRGGSMELTYALFAKWRNIIYFSTKYLNNRNPGCKAYYGDFWGVAPFHSIKDWSGPYSLESLFSTSVNDGGKFAEANETANAGNIVVNGETWNVTGNLRELFGASHVYNYEQDLSVSQGDYNAFFSAQGVQQDIRLWMDKLQPNLFRFYDWCLNAALSEYVKQGKGWSNYVLTPQHESIYEFNFRDKTTGQFLNGAFVPWTTNGVNPVKVPLHPEVITTLTYIDRLFYQGSYFWGGAPRINPDTRLGENLHPQVHQLAREAHQKALDMLAQYDQTVFQPGKRTHLRDIPVLNQANGQYVTGGSHILLMANGNANNPVPLVVGVDNPGSGWELYLVYYPHQSRTATTNVTWKSPVDGAVLTGVATGWGGTLYARKR